MGNIGSTAEQLKADCQAFQRDAIDLEHRLGMQRARVRQNRELTEDEPQEKLAKRQPLEESYCDTDEETQQPEDGEEEDDSDEETEQSEDGEEEDNSNEETEQSEDGEEADDSDEETQQSEDGEEEDDSDEETQQSEDGEEEGDWDEETEQSEDGEEEDDSDEETQQSEDGEEEDDSDEETQQSEDGEEEGDWDEETEQSEDGEEEDDSDEETQQFEDSEDDSETLSTRKILTETDLYRYYMELQEAYVIEQQLFASELHFERSTNKVLQDELEKLQVSNNELSQRYEAENLRAGQQANHLMAKLEQDEAQMHSFQAEQNFLRLQIMEEMSCLRNSAAEEKMLLQRQVEELTYQLSLKKEREDVKHQDWQEERDEEKQEKKWGELQEASIIKQQMLASELQFERSTVKALLDELDTLRASNNEVIQRAEADNLRAGQQASHLTTELENVTSQMWSFQAEQNFLRLQITEEMRGLSKSAAEEKMLLQRQVEELRASKNEVIQRAEADNLRAGQQAIHLTTELEKVTSQMWSFQAEQNFLRLQITEEMRCLSKSAAEEKMLLQRQVEELRASKNEVIQRAEADNLRAGQQASHLKAELEKVTSQMQSFQAELNLLHLQLMEEMRYLCKSAAEEKMLLQREEEELTSQLSLRKEGEDIKHQEWQEDRDEEKQEVKWGEEQQEKEEEKWGKEAGGGEPVDKPAYPESLSDALPVSEPVETELSEETPKKKKSSIWKKIRQHLGLRRKKKQPHN